MAVLITSMHLGMAMACVPAQWGASAIVHPHRRAVTVTPDLPFEDVTFTSRGATLKGWWFRTSVPRRGVLVYLHGIGDNRQSGLGFAHRFLPEGYDVLAYDSRAHGESSSANVTYGVYEKDDVRAALDSVHADRVILFGASLGASVALQAAPLDNRIVGVIAQSPFADLRSIVHDRKPWIFSHAKVDAALQLAEDMGAFHTDKASVLLTAPQIRVPVLLIHGQADHDTRLAHSQRIFDALAGPKELLIVPGGHNDTLALASTWRKIDAWLAALPR